MLEGVGDGACLSDLDGTITRVNAAARILTGRTEGEAVGGTCEDLLGCAGGEACPRRRVGPGRTWVEATCRGTRADGKPLVLRVRARLVYDDAGRPTGHLSLFSEASLQESLQRKIVVYERLASLGELATSLVHEVGNPVSVILGFARLLVQREGADPGGEIRERIFREAERCRKIVGQLLDYARSSTRSPTLVPVDLKGIVQEVLELLEYRFRRGGLSSRLTWDADVPSVLADPGELKQVFLNLYLNALDASEPGGQVLTVGEAFREEVTLGGGSLSSPVPERARQGWVRVRVADEGAGLGAGDPERLFAPFYTTKEKGGGLGLTVCRRIVEERGGRIRLEARPDGGAQAVVELPAGTLSGVP